MAGMGKPYGGRPGDAFEGLVQRIRLIVPATLRGGGGESGPYSPSNPPSRCAFQFHGQDGSDEAFPIEYVLRLMNDWADVPCNPYLRVQNTGVSVLFQGFFNRPHGAPGGAITAEQTNVILHSTETTGLSLGDLDDVKGRLGLDARPMMASMWISCFVRMPRVQLAFRFMGPEDAVRTRRILCRAAEQALARRRRSRRSQDDYGAGRWRRRTTLPERPGRGSPPRARQRRPDGDRPVRGIRPCSCSGPRVRAPRRFCCWRRGCFWGPLSGGRLARAYERGRATVPPASASQTPASRTSPPLPPPARFLRRDPRSRWPPRSFTAPAPLPPTTSGRSACAGSCWPPTTLSSSWITATRIRTERRVRCESFFAGRPRR
uniref:UL34 n=1 Tax=Human herpesvirus 2 TaxID=10310 RepID=A0A481TR89_HHV2|nr:UL34 [Human alphaherpesvirus 2]